jgi:hypothetical protein
MNVDIQEGHFILMAALLYNERGSAASEEAIRADILRAVETVRKIPTKNLVSRAVTD